VSVAKKRYYWSSVFDCVLQEKDQSGDTQVTYTHEPSTYGPLVSENRGGQKSQYHFDALGSTRALTSASQTVTDTFGYDAWGNEVVRTGVTTTPFRWLGRLGYSWQADVSVYSARIRTFRSEDARWLSGARAFAIDSLNGFIYVLNSPQLFVDPSGLMCTVCLTSAYYRQKISTLDALVMNRSFSALATFATNNHVVSPWGIQLFGLPDMFPNAGTYFNDNKEAFMDPTGFRIIPHGAKSAAYLFFVTFDICETQAGDCRLFLDETGTTLITYRPGQPPEVDMSHSINHGDITGNPDNRIDNLRFVPPGSPCDKIIIYCDMPSLLAIIQPQGKFWGTQVVKQTLEVKDASAGLAIVASFSHTVTIGVGERGEEIVSP